MMVMASFFLTKHRENIDMYVRVQLLIMSESLPNRRRREKYAHSHSHTNICIKFKLKFLNIKRSNILQEMP